MSLSVAQVFCVGLSILTLSVSSQSVSARSSAPVDLTRLNITLGEHVLVGLPAETLATLGWVGPIAYDSWADDGVNERPKDALGLLELGFSPRILATGYSWPLFQHYLAEFELRTRQTYDLEDGDGVADELADFDPERQARHSNQNVHLVQAFAQAVGRRAAVKVGLTRSHWGAGVLANDHERPVSGVFESPFGAPEFFDRTLRAQVAYFPMEQVRRGDGLVRPLVLVATGDMTFADGTTDWAAGDRVRTGIAALRAEFGPFRGGLYAAHRIQEHALGGRTQVTALDAQGDVRWRLGDTRLRIMSELALVIGETDYARSVFVDSPMDVLSHGGVVRVGVEHGMFEAVLEGGWASGDANPYDGTVGAFSFNSGYRVGLLMFSEVLKTQAAASVANISDPDLREDAPRAIDRVSHRGVVTNAVYLNPRLALTPWEDITLLAGAVVGWSYAEFADPFWSSLQGGVATGPLGGSSSRDLGVELDVGVHAAIALGRLKLHVRGEVAYFKPGAVFHDSAGQPASDVFGGSLSLGVQL